MQMEPVDSSNVSAVGYDPVTETLHVKYKGGPLYEYSGVPQNTHDELMAAGLWDLSESLTGVEYSFEQVSR